MKKDLPEFIRSLAVFTASLAALYACGPARMLMETHNYQDSQRVNRRQMEVSSKVVELRADGELHPSGASRQWRGFNVRLLPSLNAAQDYGDLRNIPGLSVCREFYVAEVEAEDARYRYYFCHDRKEPALIRAYRENEIGMWEAFPCPACP